MASSHRIDRSHLAPEDAFYTASRARRFKKAGDGNTTATTITDTEARPRSVTGSSSSYMHKKKLDSRSRSRQRRKRSWKKILWVKQSFPDNYTDQTTFLDSLQRNPRLQPYEFWPLVADTTVIVQQVCSVTIFIVCFVGIYTERVSPVAVVGWGSFATFIGWLFWDWWVGEQGDDEKKMKMMTQKQKQQTGHCSRQQSSSQYLYNSNNNNNNNNGHTNWTNPSNTHSAASSMSNLHAHQIQIQGGLRHRPSSPLRGGRTSSRLGTIKSAALIYFTILGLSPILKSLTRSTSPDSIWAMSFWLLAINVLFFDYSGGVGAKFPASLSTNAALMASTVLASRLPSTGQVFSLTLFSIEVFGLFPVFRRYARHQSWRYHVAISVMLVIGAGGGVGLILSERKEDEWPWRSGLLGVLVGALIAIVTMGASSWWLIGLQKYKNAMNGPWDAARPIIISRHELWDDD